MSFSTPQLSLAEMLEVARRFGYDGIEPRLDVGHAHGVEVAATAEQRRTFRQRAAGAGIELACLATSLKFADPATDETVRLARERIDLAGDLGVPAIRVFGGRIPDGVTRDQAVEHVAGTLSRVAQHASDRGVTVCLETHDDWCDPAHVAAVLQRVDHPSIAANWDIMHPIKTAGVTMDAAFETLEPWIRHLHIHDGTDAGLVPIGTGNIDHRRAVELLAQIDYRGFLSGEWIKWEPYEVHLPRELATIRAYERR